MFLKTFYDGSDHTNNTTLEPGLSLLKWTNTLPGTRSSPEVMVSETLYRVFLNEELS
jgi:hypothetical protein